MKIWIFSDLHRDFEAPPVDIPPDADVAVVAGDVQDDELLIRLGNTLPTVYVAGNHDFYGHEYAQRLENLRNLPSEQLYVLENEELVLGDVRFLGCTLWTDYNGGDPTAMTLAQFRMNDHRKIKWQKQPWKRFRPEEALMLHRKSKNWLNQRFSEPFDGKTVVITHHAPSERSVAPKFAGDMLNHAYYSALDAEIERWGAGLHIHGHTHTSFRYKIGKTEIICNPKGYHNENPMYDPALIGEI